MHTQVFFVAENKNKIYSLVSFNYADRVYLIALRDQLIGLSTTSILDVWYSTFLLSWFGGVFTMLTEIEEWLCFRAQWHFSFRAYTDRTCKPRMHKHQFVFLLEVTKPLPATEISIITSRVTLPWHWKPYYYPSFKSVENKMQNLINGTRCSKINLNK